MAEGLGQRRVAGTDGSIAIPRQQQAQPHSLDGSIAIPRQQQAQPRQLEKVHTDASADEAAGGCSTAPQSYVLMSPNATPLVGVSRQALKIGNQLLLAARTSAPLVVTGEPGLNTLKLAATVHAIALDATGESHQPLVVVDCASATGQAAAQQLLSGTGALCSSLLRKLLRGTLVLNHAHLAPLELLQAIDAAAATLSQHAANTSRPDQAQPAATDAVGPGASLSGLGTRLVVISQRPHVQLLEQLALAGTAAAACSGSCRCKTEPAAVSAGCGGAGTGCSGRCEASRRSGVPGLLPGGLAKAMLVALPALRQRSSDIAPLAVAAGTGVAWQRGYSAVSLTPAAIKQLTSYAFPGNEAELKGLVKRAVMLHPLADTSSGGCASLTLDADDFWSATQAADRARLDALEVFPWIKTLLLDTGIWPHGLNAITKWLYPLLVAALFLGPQDRQHSAALTVFWAGWWPLVFLSFPFVGRAWCSICPFMVTGEEVQHMVDKEQRQPIAAASAAAPAVMAAQAASAAPPGNPKQHLQQLVAPGWGWQLKKWPAEQLAAWSGWFVAVGFALILAWEEVDNLPDSAALSGWLLMLITGGAVACSVVYEKRLWCRHLCPVGGMNGLMAKMSMTEVRSRPGICAAAACSRPCHNGREVAIPAAAVPRPAEPSGRRSLNLAGQAAVRLGLLKPPAAADTSNQVKQLPGCPMNTSPGKNQDNKDCINCLNCLSSCGSSSAQLRLRPPAADLWGDHSASWSEVALLFVLLGAVGLHRLPELCEQVGIPASAVMGDTTTHILASFAVLAAPGSIALAADRLAPAVQGLAGRKAAVPTVGGHASFLRMSYSLVPMVWAGTLAYFESLMLTELMLTWPRLLGSLGIASDGPDAAWLLGLVPHIPPAPAAVVSAAQGCTLLLGTALSWVLAGKIAVQDVGPDAAGPAAQGQRLLILLATWELWQLIL